MTQNTKNWKRKNNKDKKRYIVIGSCWLLIKLHAASSLQQSLLQSTHNTKPDTTIHTDISKIIGQCRHDLTLEASLTQGGGGRGYTKKFYPGRLLPEVQPTQKVPLLGGGSPSCPRIRPLQRVPAGSFRRRSTSLSYIHAHASRPLQFIVFVGKTICMPKKKIMVEQWNRDGGRVKHLMVEQWNRECGTVDHLMVEQ